MLLVLALGSVALIVALALGGVATLVFMLCFTFFRFPLNVVLAIMALTAAAILSATSACSVLAGPPQAVPGIAIVPTQHQVQQPADTNKWHTREGRIVTHPDGSSVAGIVLHSIQC